MNGAQSIGHIYQLAVDEPDFSSWQRKALTEIRQAAGAQAAALMKAAHGTWQFQSSSGAAPRVPHDFLAEVLDRGHTQLKGSEVATPVSVDAHNELLWLHFSSPAAAEEFLPAIDQVAQAMLSAKGLHADQAARRRQVERMETILEIAATWNQQHEMLQLLEQMAQAATRLFDCDRASIFLWDKPNELLVGRPALGVEGGELRIPDDRGVVGRVVQSGKAERVHAEQAPEEAVVDRSVDERTGFVTRSLLCVPLRGKSGDIFGAFELINKQESDPTDFTTSSAGAAFSDDDLVGLTELAAHAAVALENCQEYEQLLRRRRELTEQAAENARLFGDSPAIEAVRSTVRRVADTDLAVLILGENGTGKEVVSQLIHFLSRRRDEPFIAVNCAALTETLLESELFGHEKGAFTDAVETRQGKFEAAHGGTLFLDEIGELNPSGQAKLLRVLEEKEVVKVGGVESKKVDTRVLAATNRDLSAMVREKRFREDLFYRLNVVAIELPPLRERGDDILLLGEFFLKDFSARAHRKTPKLTAAAKKRMLAHSWPGNVRELRNLMERIAYLTSGDKIDVDEIAFVLSPGKTDMAEPLLELGLSDATSKFQTEFIQRHIQACRGNISEASKRLGLHRSNLYRKMRQLGMSTDMEAASE